MGNICSDCMASTNEGRSRGEALFFTPAKSKAPPTIITEREEITSTLAVASDASFQTILKNAKHQSDLLFLQETSNDDIAAKHDYRGFVICLHDTYGLLLLHCTRKKNKPPHYQLPGGHVDDFELNEQQQQHSTATAALYFAARAGCARELYEETGINVRQELDRFQPAVLNPGDRDKTNKKLKLINAYKHRLFFVLHVKDEDFFQKVRRKGPVSSLHASRYNTYLFLAFYMHLYCVTSRLLRTFLRCGSRDHMGQQREWKKS